MLDDHPSGLAHLGKCAGAVAAALALAHPAQAEAQTRSSPLAQGLLDLPANDGPAVERYQTPDGRVRFVLDRSGARVALVRFDGSDEVHVLRAVPGPRGDDLYKTDTGDVLLRMTAFGSVIVYADPKRMGAPAQAAGFSAPVPPPEAPKGGLRVWLQSVQREAARRLGRQVEFQAPEDAHGAASGVVADAAARAAEGLATMPETVQVSRVVIRYGAQPHAVVVSESLTITIAPQMGYAGRPSSAAVQAALRRQEPVNALAPK
jgi:hypothetical protein